MGSFRILHKIASLGASDQNLFARTQESPDRMDGGRPSHCNKREQVEPSVMDPVICP